MDRILGKETIRKDLQAIRSKAPLVHNITNFVAMDITANALLALGASPVMAHSKEEVDEMARLASSLVLNIGTLTPSWVESMQQAMAIAKANGKPVVLDPVGAGATSFRTQTAGEIVSRVPTVIRGNASEIMALLSSGRGNTKGVDSSVASLAARDLARELAARVGCVVVVSGEVDLIVDKQREAQVRNGHPLMTKVTGVGCTCSALMGAFLAVNSDPFEAAVHTMAAIGIAGELAAKVAGGPGSFRVELIDAIGSLGNLDLEPRIESK